jgi:hypothetical protein
MGAPAGNVGVDVGVGVGVGVGVDVAPGTEDAAQPTPTSTAANMKTRSIDAVWQTGGVGVDDATKAR